MKLFLAIKVYHAGVSKRCDTPIGSIGRGEDVCDDEILITDVHGRFSLGYNFLIRL